MPQTSYLLDTVAALPGQLVSSKAESLVGRYKASEAIPPGRMCELHTDGTLRLYRGGKKAGISLYRDTKDPDTSTGNDGAGAIDDDVPMVRRGTVWAALAGSAGADLADANFSYKDTTTADRGKATAAVPSGAADAQVYDGGPCRFMSDSVASSCQLVECDFPAEDYSPTASQTLVSHAANDFAINPTNFGVYELNTTAANSTVSLPASTPDGTVCFISADGTKNGHTLTFRDVTTAISAATTASKRVAAVLVKVGGAWTCTLTVGP